MQPAKNILSGPRSCSRSGIYWWKSLRTKPDGESLPGRSSVTTSADRHSRKNLVELSQVGGNWFEGTIPIGSPYSELSRFVVKLIDEANAQEISYQFARKVIDE